MYVINKLTENGFQVKYTHPNLLWISWQHYIPHYERANIKKQYGVSIDGFGNVIKKSDKKRYKFTFKRSKTHTKKYFKKRQRQRFLENFNI